MNSAANEAQASRTTGCLTTASERVEHLLGEMTLAEKLGQMQQIHGWHDGQRELIRRGGAGSILNHANTADQDYAKNANEIQGIAVKESRLGIPLVIGRDVIHGFRTVFPIPLGQSATWNPDVVEEGAAIAAREAASCGIRWTFAPMVDVSRDPRWGRIAESCGEDPLLSARFGAAMVRGFQGTDLSQPDRIAACAKHYVGYGAAESGRDYNTTWIPENQLREVYLPPFKACVDAGAATVMTAFNEINGIPASGNRHTVRGILKSEWNYEGMVVSDWASITEMIPHGFCEGERDAAKAALSAGIDMEMVTESYVNHIEDLLNAGEIESAWIDDAVRRILLLKEALGLFETPYVDEEKAVSLVSESHAAVAKRAAAESCVLLKNEDVLPFTNDVKTLAVIGPLADSPTDQMGCWTFDGLPEDVVTPLQALREANTWTINYARGLESARSTEAIGFAEALAAAETADAVCLFLGEDAVLSGESHCRAFLGLPGAQTDLLKQIHALSKPTVAVIMAGRPLVLTDVLPCVDAILWAWHPGTMGGPAIADLLSGQTHPRGRLPVSFPQAVGQIPVYYATKNTGRPAPTDKAAIPTGTPLDPENFCSCYMDVDNAPLFPFGYGLGYTTFAYSDLKLSDTRLSLDGGITLTATIRNTGNRTGTETVQLYVRDCVGSTTRPVRELKDWQQVTLEPGQETRVEFHLNAEHLAFCRANGTWGPETGKFMVWVGGDAASGQEASFELID